MVGVARGVDAGEALAAAHEVEERLAPRRGRRRIVRIVEERAGGAGEEDGVVLLQVRVVDVGRVVGDRRRPRAGLLADLLDGARGERDRRVDEAGRLRRAPAPCAAASAWPARLSGSAAIIAVTSSGAGVWFCGGAPPAGAGGGSAEPTPKKTCSSVSALLFAVSHCVYQSSNVDFISSRVTAPSLLVSSSVKSDAARCRRRPAAPSLRWGLRRGGRRAGATREDGHNRRHCDEQKTGHGLFERILSPVKSKSSAATAFRLKPEATQG